jgi:hypothetical protein
MKAYIIIDDARPVYPVFYLSAQDPAAVEIPATSRQIAKWKAAFKAYAAAQTEIETAVNHYQPAAIRRSA